MFKIHFGFASTVEGHVVSVIPTEREITINMESGVVITIPDPKPTVFNFLKKIKLQDLQYTEIFMNQGTFSINKIKSDNKKAEMAKVTTGQKYTQELQGPKKAIERLKKQQEEEAASIKESESKKKQKDTADKN